MGIQEENNQEAKSKIEQIRIDLEKKLAAIENSKKNIEGNESVDLEKEKLIKKVEPIAKSNEIDSNPVFEISEPIVPVVPESKKPLTIVNKEFKKEVEQKEELGEKKKEVKVVVPVENVKKKVSVPPKTIISSVATKTSVEKNKISSTEINQSEDLLEKEESKTKRGVLSYLIYALLIGLFATIAYLYIDYNRENKSLEEEKMNQKLSEFKNKRYLDSIELADLNTQLEDLQSKKMLDSLDRVYEQELIANSKFKNKKAIQRNFDLSSLNKVSSKSINDTKNVIANNAKAEVLINKRKQNIANTKVKGEKDTDNLNSDLQDNKTELAKSNDKDQPKTELDSESKTTDLSTKEIAAIKNTEAVASTTKKVDTKVKKKLKKSPIYPGCEKKKTEVDRKKCLTTKMHRYVSRKFNSDMAQNMGLNEGIHVVRIQYIIDKSGYATVLNVRAENKKLEQEAIRVIQSLPKMTPGTSDGKRVGVQYNMPIKFAVNN